MPAMLYIQINRAQLRAAKAKWRPGSPQYESSLLERLWAIRNFFLPFFMVVFGVIAMIAGVATAVITELSVTKT